MDKFLKMSAGLYRHPWMVLAVTAVVTVFFALGIPRVTFDNDLKAMIPADNRERQITDYYESETAFGRSSSYFMGIESTNAFSVETLKYLQALSIQINKLNDTLPTKITASLLKISAEEAGQLVRASREQGVSLATMPDFLALVQNPEKAAKTFGWKPELAARLAQVTTGVEAKKLYETLQPPVKRTQSLIDADFIVNRDDQLVSEKLIAEGTDITPEVAAETKKKALSWDIYESALYSKDFTLATLVVEPANLDIDVSEALVAELRQVASTPPAGLKVYVDGEPVINHDMGSMMRADLVVLMPLVVLAVMLVLFLSFRNWQGVLFPMVVVAVAVICSLGAMGWLGVPLSMASLALPPLMVAIAAAYGIHQMNHYFLDPENDKLKVLEHNLSVVGLAIVLSGLTVMIGFGALAVESFVPIRNFGLFTAWGDLVAVAVALWAMPALLLVGRKPKTVQLHEEQKGPVSAVLRGLVKLNQKHSKAVVVTGIVVSLLIGAGAIWMKSDLNNISFFKPEALIRQADDKLNEKLAGTENLIVILDTNFSETPVEGDPQVLTTPEVLQKVEAFSQAVQAKFPFVQKVMSFNDVLKKMNREMQGGELKDSVIPADANLIAQYLLIFSGDLQSWLSPAHDKLRLSLSMKHMGTVESEKVSQFARDYFDPAFREANHVRVEIAGLAHLYFVANTLMMEGLVLSIVVCVVLVFLILLLVLKNLRMSLIAMTPIFATLMINFGALGILNIPLNTVTAMVSSIAVGIGVDFSIHFITWYRGALRRNRNIEFALEDSILHKGRAIVFNMLVIVAGFAVLMVSNFVPLIHFGLLVSLCMVTTAVGALVLVPAMIRWLHKKDRPWLYLE